MNPENPQPTPTSTPTTPPLNPAPAPQPSTVPQPAATAQAVTGMAPPTKENLQKQAKVAMVLSIISIAIFVIGIIFGFTWALAAILGAYGAAIGVRTKSVPLIIVGAIGLVLNFGLYTISIFSNL